MIREKIMNPTQMILGSDGRMGLWVGFEKVVLSQWSSIFQRQRRLSVSDDDVFGGFPNRFQLVLSRLSRRPQLFDNPSHLDPILAKEIAEPVWAAKAFVGIQEAFLVRCDIRLRDSRVRILKLQIP